MLHTTTAGAVALVPTPTPSLSLAHLAHLRESGLTDETIAAAGIYSIYSPRDLAAAIGHRSWPQGGGGVATPYFRPSLADPVLVRVRPDHPRVETRPDGRKRPVKYEHPLGVPLGVYYPPRTLADRLGDVTTSLVWAEGEKKALVLDQLGYAAIGLAGVWCAHDADARRTTRRWRLHRWIRDDVTVAGRDHVIVFDSDAAESPDVRAAEARLGDMLTAAGARSVRVVRIPAAADGGKVGIDDYFVAHGAVATKVLLAPPPPPVARPAPAAPPPSTTTKGTRVPKVPAADDVPPDGEPIILFAAGRPVYRYWPVPVDILSRPARGADGLATAAKLLLGAIAAKADEHGVVDPCALGRHERDASHAGLGDVLCIAPATVRGHVATLRGLGAISTEHAYGAARRPDTVTITPEWWRLWQSYEPRDPRDPDAPPDPDEDRAARIASKVVLIPAGLLFALRDADRGRRKPISHLALVVYGVVAWTCSDLGPRPIATDDLAAMTGTASGLVHRALRELVAAGLLDRRPGRHGTLLVPLMAPWLRAPGARILDAAGHPRRPSPWRRGA